MFPFGKRDFHLKIQAAGGCGNFELEHAHLKSMAFTPQNSRKPSCVIAIGTTFSTSHRYDLSHPYVAIMSESKKITMEELKQHTSHDDLWLLIDGKGE